MNQASRLGVGIIGAGRVGPVIGAALAGAGHALTGITASSDPDRVEAILPGVSVLPADEILYLKTTANISTGGTAIDRTDEVHPENVFLFERIARIIGLQLGGGVPLYRDG